MDEADVRPAGEEPAVEAESTHTEPESATLPETAPAAPVDETPSADPAEAETNAAEPVAIAEEEIDEPALKAVIEAIIYVTEDPVAPQQIAAALQKPEAVVKRLFEELVADYAQPRSRHHDPRSRRRLSDGAPSPSITKASAPSPRASTRR